MSGMDEAGLSPWHGCLGNLASLFLFELKAVPLWPGWGRHWRGLAWLARPYCQWRRTNTCWADAARDVGSDYLGLWNIPRGKMCGEMLDFLPPCT